MSIIIPHQIDQTKPIKNTQVNKNCSTPTSRLVTETEGAMKPLMIVPRPGMMMLRIRRRIAIGFEVETSSA